MEHSYLSFHVGSYLLGVSADNLVEVNRNLKYTNIPGSPKMIRGILNLRGSLMPLIDLGAYLNIADAKNGTMCIILKVENHEFAIMVDSIGDIASFNTDDLTPPPSQLGEEFQKTIIGAYRLSQGLLIILDMTTIFANSQSIETKLLNEPETAPEKQP